jgi:hypothetical protein
VLLTVIVLMLIALLGATCFIWSLDNSSGGLLLLRAAACVAITLRADASRRANQLEFGKGGFG